MEFGSVTLATSRQETGAEARHVEKKLKGVSQTCYDGTEMTREQKL